MRIARSARGDSLLRATPIHVAVIAMGVLWAEPGSAVQESRQRYRLPAARVDEAPVLDGVLDDVIWLRASVIDQFVQQEPDEGAPATERTEVLILYDAANLYIGVRAYDSQPGGIVSTEWYAVLFSSLGTRVTSWVRVSNLYLGHKTDHEPRSPRTRDHRQACDRGGSIRPPLPRVRHLRQPGNS